MPDYEPIPLDGDGYLSRDVEITLAELETGPFVTGDGMRVRRWDSSRRIELARNTRRVVERLWCVGFEGEIEIDGSFATSNIKPRDVDVVCICTPRDLFEYPTRLDELNALEGEPIWCFGDDDLVSVPGMKGLVAPLWRRYHVDLRFDFGQFCGIFGAGGERLTFPEAFRLRKISRIPKGVIRIRRDQSPDVLEASV